MTSKFVSKAFKNTSSASAIFNNFHVEELVVPAMWPRSTPLSTRRSNDRLSIACKIYTSKQEKSLDTNDGIGNSTSDASTRNGDKFSAKSISPSVFFVHGNGFPKECYEPMLYDFSEKMKNEHGMSLKYILTMDIVNQGQSAVINEPKLGNDCK